MSDIDKKEKGFVGKDLTALVLNILLILLFSLGLIRTLLDMHYLAYEYYTQLSNYFGFIATVIYTCFFINKKKIPKWVSILKYSATLSMTVTFLVVAFILTPMLGFKEIFVWIFFSGSNLFYHTLCPIIMFISFVFYEKHDIKGFRDNLRAMYFTMIYAIIFITLNILKIYDGPYPFLKVYEQPVYMSIIWFILIVGGAFGIGKGIMWMKDRKKII